MRFTKKVTQIRAILPDDPKFILKDEHTVCPRAGFQISETCPKEYKDILRQCIEYKWIKPIAYVYAKELTFQSLSE